MGLAFGARLLEVYSNENVSANVVKELLNMIVVKAVYEKIIKALHF